MNPNHAMGKCAVLLVSLAALLFSTSARAITIATVPVGNPGNAADLRFRSTDNRNGLGAVAQKFNIGTTEVTNSQYVAFLNAVAVSDPYDLYSSRMASDTQGGIVRNGSEGNYSYSVKSPALNGTYTYDNKPVVYVGWGDAARFTNWLHNGQPIGAQNATTTENGAYTLNGAISDTALAAITRSATAHWWVPSESEWYKAAFYNPSSASYFLYPTRSDTLPNNNIPANDTGNSANGWSNGYTTGNENYPMTDAGAYTLSDSPYGTFDQGGNVREWTETLNAAGTKRRFRGGGWEVNIGYTVASESVSYFPTFETYYLGFRVAQSAATPGDFNGNGNVDSADYVVWRNNQGSAADYNLWRANLGASTPASGTSLGDPGTVPEPSWLVLTLPVVGSIYVRRRTRR